MGQCSCGVNGRQRLDKGMGCQIVPHDSVALVRSVRLHLVWQSIVDLEGTALLSSNWPAVHFIPIRHSCIGMPLVLSWRWLDRRADLPHTTSASLTCNCLECACHCHGLTHSHSASCEAQRHLRPASLPERQHRPTSRPAHGCGASAWPSRPGRRAARCARPAGCVRAACG
jgi:hypothetical protein